MSPHWVTSKDAADYLGITRDALRKRVERGEVGYRKLGRRLWFNVAELDEFMNRAEHRVDAWQLEDWIS
jgi:excisionase family DNA binding protein